MTWCKVRGKPEWLSSEGYVIRGNDSDGFEAFSPTGAILVFWAATLAGAKRTCEESLVKRSD